MANLLPCVVDSARRTLWCLENWLELKALERVEVLPLVVSDASHLRLLPTF